MQVKPVIQSKLMPPIPSATYMRRASFIKKLRQSSHMKLTIMHSGAGYGKSSGLATYFYDTDATYSWYSVTEEDDDILPFITHLTQSIRRIRPSFGHSFTEWGIIHNDLDIERWLVQFMNELCEIVDPFYLIIDDFHHVDHVFTINYILEKMIQLLPPSIHLVVASRTRPRWSSLAKLKMMGQSLELTEEDLLFSEEEVAVFYEDYFNQILTEEEALSIVQLTEGWAIAVNLLAIHLTGSEKDFSVEMKPALQDLFAYLSEEVFNRMSETEKRWALSFSIFPMFSTDLIEEFYGKEANDVLRELASRHVFIQSLGEGVYRYHALFQQFLERKWRSVNLAEYVIYQKKAVAYYLQQSDPTQAILHAVKSDDASFIGQIIMDNGATLIRSGQFEWLLEILKNLHPIIKEQHYPLYYYEGEAHRYRAYYEKARTAYLTCIEIAETCNDDYYIGRAHAGIAHIYLDTIQPGLADPHLLNAILYAERSVRTSSHEKELLKRQFAENLVNLGKGAAAAEWVKQEITDTRILQEGNLDARIALRTGKLNEAQTILTTREHSSVLPDSHRETDVLLSLIYAMTGQSSLAITSAENGISLGKEEKSVFIEAVGRIRLGHAKILEDPFTMDASKTYYLRAIEQMDELNVSRGNAEPYMGLAILFARLGHFTEAIRYGKAGLHETDRVQDGWLSGLIHISLGIVYKYAKDDLNAEKHLKEAERLLMECGDQYGKMVVTFWLMRIYSQKADEELFTKYADEFFSLLYEQDYFYFLTSDTMFGPFDRQSIYPLVIQASKLHPDHAGIQQAIHILELKDVENHPGYKLDVCVLGPFTVNLGLDGVQERKWQRDKAKELFLYLLLNKTRYVPKEEIMQALWTDIDEKTADRDFKVALNALLKVLEPNRSARESSFFILRKQTMYQLNPQAAIQTDLERFKQYMEKGLAEKVADQSIEHLLKAAALYKGKLFEEKLSVEWIATEREQVEQHYIQVIEKLAQSYTRLQQYNKTIEWAERLVRIDPTWEEAYRLLMYAHYQLQNRPQSIKWYNRCTEILEEEFSIRPMESTEQMYKMIMNEL
ncbi:BTAD domain-containing putative transcriptional regulator [Sporosarcina oncorhynchi]|uniref:BTAD domain-containing putative transcriptional regulator n=1 Tax=Sporosarcina oncorhynchi TaxID=3056444 RepID=A0ABZ0L736_9BACL|nr:BTAD domain-containing putative transcriptional regulator [Sporosarcina sp. T2O-4]WOV88375.1 BTAD domain-containing putative transcriptional regulator [Sporosarcina sp. T2O-4]